MRFVVLLVFPVRGLPNSSLKSYKKKVKGMEECCSLIHCEVQESTVDKESSVAISGRFMLAKRDPTDHISRVLEAMKLEGHTFPTDVGKLIIVCLLASTTR